MNIVSFIQSNENYLIDKMILMVITGTGFVNAYAVDVIPAKAGILSLKRLFMIFFNN